MPSSALARKKAPCWAATVGVSSDMMSLDTVCRSRWPCIIPEILARLVLSQSCSSFLCVVSRRLAIRIHLGAVAEELDAVGAGQEEIE